MQMTMGTIIITITMKCRSLHTQTTEEGRSDTILQNCINDASLEDLDIVQLKDAMHCAGIKQHKPSTIIIPRSIQCEKYDFYNN